MFRIRHAAKLAGINPTLLRAWERRYHLVSPARTTSGYRVYTPQDVEVLRAAARLVAAGHTIGEVARLPAIQLTEAAARLLPVVPIEEPGANAGADVKEGAAAAAIDGALAEALDGIARFDRQQFEAALFPITTMAGIGPVALCETVLLPLLRKIGDRWEAGTLTIAAEHFGSALCRAKILQCLEFVARTASGPRAVCACPEGELHEGGLLAFAVRAASAQWQVIYLGAHTPMQGALDTAVRIAADLVALSLTVSRSDHEIAILLRAVSDAKAKRPQLRVLAGGRQAVAMRDRLESGGIEVPLDIHAALPLPGGESTRDGKSPAG